MDLLFRLSKDKVEGFENEVKTKNFFNKKENDYLWMGYI